MMRERERAKEISIPLFFGAAYSHTEVTFGEENHVMKECCKPRTGESMDNRSLKKAHDS